MELHAGGPIQSHRPPPRRICRFSPQLHILWTYNLVRWVRVDSSYTSVLFMNGNSKKSATGAFLSCHLKASQSPVVQIVSRFFLVTNIKITPNDREYLW